MIKKVASPNSRECQGDCIGNKNRILTFKDNLTSILFNPSSDSSGSIPAILSPASFDLEPEEPELSKPHEYDDCNTCYMRINTIGVSGKCKSFEVGGILGPSRM